MKKILLTSLCIASVLLSRSQNNDQIYPTGAKAKTEEQQKFFNRNIKTANFLNKHKSTNVDKVSFIDNSKLKFFPPIFRQNGASCAQAAGVGYVYTYEVNRMLDRDASMAQNRFSYMYTWNYLNNGKGIGSNEIDGWNIIRDNGAVVESDWDTDSYTEWPNGYGIYEKAFKYTIDECTKIVRDRNDYKKAIRELKQFLIDHGDGSKFGGILTISAYSHDLSGRTKYNGPSNTGYTCIVPKFPQSGAHAMTLVGFDDSIEWDSDENGEISEDERGAFIVVNSWGAKWGDRGRFYMPYILLSKTALFGGPFSEYLIVKPKIKEPKLYFKVKMQYSSRNDISFELGVSKDENATKPEKVFRTWAMMHSGGDLPIRGKLPEAMFPDLEFALNADPLIEYIGDADNPRFYLKIVTAERGEAGDGELISFSVVDNRNKSNSMQLNYIDNYIPVGVENDLSLNLREVEYEFNKQDIDFSLKMNDNGKYSFYINAKTESEIILDIVDASGNILKNIYKGKAELGFDKFDINTDGLKPNVYSIRILTHNQMTFRKIRID
ncbi:MAG: hypothetical protein N4A49_12945 [Marinifilaceae bacterium]|jgi:hypothetical protein|nr:hypothetical protein [Marinifilaceae bacterium]